MKVRIQVIVESDQGETQCVEDVAQFERGALQPEALGLTLAEAKALLQGVQRTMVAEQTTAYLDAQHPCPACGTPRRCKGHHPAGLSHGVWEADAAQSAVVCVSVPDHRTAEL